jgi:Zn-dependent protease with chaperone function
MVLKSIGVLLLCFVSLVGSEQIEKNYFPAPVLDTLSLDMLNALKLKLEKDKARINEPSREANAFLKSLYEKRYEYLIKTVNDDFFVVDSAFTPFLQSILDKIYKANPQLPREAQVYAMRSSVPNAVSFGDGTVGFTLSLLARMENEDQVAFILCHEIAHYHSEHSVTDLKELARLNYDKDLKRRIDELKKNQYGRYTKLTEIFKSMGLSLTRHSRVHEVEADSLGFAYFSAMRYDLRQASRVMEILDSVSIPMDTSLIDFKKHFDFKDYPFKTSWLKYVKSSTWHAPTIEDDSMQTHPDCKRRAVALERQRLRLPGERTSASTTGRVPRIRVKSQFELIHSDYHFKQYGRALFRALLLTDQYPDNVYLQAIISKCLYKLFIYQRDHELGKVLELPDSRFPENYDRFLTFMHSLRLMELSSLAYHYVTTRPAVSFKDEEFLYALWLCSTLQVSKVAPDKVKAEYAERFPGGKYLRQMN